MVGLNMGLENRRDRGTGALGRFQVAVDELDVGIDNSEL
jgi:hypothetical protein